MTKRPAFGPDALGQLLGLARPQAGPSAPPTLDPTIAAWGDRMKAEARQRRKANPARLAPSIGKAMAAPSIDPLSPPDDPPNRAD